MLITDRLVYLELHKTGCNHTRKILSALFPENTTIGAHNPYDRVPKNTLGDFEAKLKMGNVRNPWDWYVSLWAYGCQNMGVLYRRLTKNYKRFSKEGLKEEKLRLFPDQFPYLSFEKWRKVYSDPYNTANFNEWLALILSDEKHELGEGYKQNSMSDFAGLMTFRYLFLYTYRKGFTSIDSPEKLVEYDAKENFMDIVIRNEAIHKELMENATRFGSNQEELEVILEQFTKRSNTSERENDFRKYYTRDSIELVSEKEKFVIDKYSYSFE